ncbi:MAG: alpha-glucosidase [Clostridium sp.]|nr:alpha-glucosidase [Clostridium sp.]
MNASTINKNIKRYIFGNPLDTDSVVIHTEDIESINEKNIKYMTLNEDKNLEYILSNDDIVYGLGENVRGLNKRGWIYESFCSDEFSHTPDKRSLYGAHNFIIIYGKETFGVFIDSPSKVTFDIGYTSKNKLKIINENSNFNLFIIEGKTLQEIVKEFRALIGESYIPPKWAFGYGQSRWGYSTEDDVKEIIKSYKDNDIPLEMLYLDIDYMEKFKDFTIEKEAFPSFEGLVEYCKSQNVRLIPIIDAGIKVEDKYDLYEEGIENNYFCTDKDGQVFTAAVWPGKVHLPDFMQPKVREWFGSKYKILTDKGIDGFWNDMNEPALFYSEEGLNKAYTKAEELRKKNIGVYEYFALKDSFASMSNSIDDYRNMYQKVNGKLVSHYDIHNLYGFNMTRAAYEGLEKIDSNKRFLLFSRASIIGAHRFGGVWTGDSSSWWEHIEMTIHMLPNLNMCGFLFVGSDTGGFSGNTTSDLLIRWNQLSLFTPLYRNHSALGTRNQEAYAFDEETTLTIRNIIKFRYCLITYLYSEFMKAVKNDSMYFKPLSFEYEDEISKGIEDQLLIGESLMIAPIYKQNSKGRYVYLPCDMLLCKVSKDGKLSFKPCREGHNFFEYSLEEIIFYVKKDKIIPLVSNINKDISKELDIIAFIEDKAEYYLYDDDGVTKDYEGYKDYSMKVLIQRVKDNYEIDVEKGSKCLIEKVNMKIISKEGKEINIVKIV